MSDAAVVVAVDGSDANAAAVDWAIGEAERSDAPLHVVTVAEPVQPSLYHPHMSAEDFARPAARDAVARARERLPEDRVSSQVTHGRVGPALRESARGQRCLVLGRRGYGQRGRLLIGSTSVGVAGRSPVPTVVVPAAWDEERRSSGTVLVGIGATRINEPALRYALTAAQERGATLHVVQAFDPHPMLTASKELVRQAFEAWQEQTGAELQQELARIAAEYPEVTVEPEQVSAHPAEALLDAESGARLTVLGGKPQGRTAGIALGSIARGVLNHATSPAVVVPGA